VKAAIAQVQFKEGVISALKPEFEVDRDPDRFGLRISVTAWVPDTVDNPGQCFPVVRRCFLGHIIEPRFVHHAVWAVMTDLLTHELAESMLVNGQFFREPHPELKS
jgi:hypothetical protein